MSRAAILAVTGLVAAIAATALAWSATAALQQEPDARRGQSVRICHATGNGKYVENSPDVDSIVSGQGHGGHPEDIIPSFDYPPSGQDPGGHYDGQNWGDEGQAIWDHGCVAPDPPDPPDPPDCNQASISATKDEYTYPEVVEMTGAGFPPEKSGEFRVVYSGGSVVSDGSVASSTSGSVGPVQVWDGANAFPGENEYRIEVTGPSCTKSDTFTLPDDREPAGTTRARCDEGRRGLGQVAKRIQLRDRKQDGPVQRQRLEPSDAPRRHLHGDRAPGGGVHDHLFGLHQHRDPRTRNRPCPCARSRTPQTRNRGCASRCAKSWSAPADLRVTSASRSAGGRSASMQTASSRVRYRRAPTPSPRCRWTGSRRRDPGARTSSSRLRSRTVPVCTITNTADNQAEHPLGISVKCVDNFPDGSFSATFGYYNPNPIAVDVEPGTRQQREPGRSRPWADDDVPVGLGPRCVHDRGHPRRHERDLDRCQRAAHLGLRGGDADIRDEVHPRTAADEGGRLDLRHVRAERGDDVHRHFRLSECRGRPGLHPDRATEPVRAGPGRSQPTDRVRAGGGLERGHRPRHPERHEPRLDDRPARQAENRIDDRDGEAGLRDEVQRRPRSSRPARSARPPRSSGPARSSRSAAGGARPRSPSACSSSA